MLDHELAALCIQFGQHFASPASDHLIAYSPIQIKVDHQNSTGYKPFMEYTPYTSGLLLLGYLVSPKWKW